MNNDDWVVLSEVKRSAYRRKSLKYLYNMDEPRTPTEIASNIEISMTHVSRALREMKDNDLVKVINPDAHYDRRYCITERGQKIIEKLQEMESE